MTPEVHLFMVVLPPRISWFTLPMVRFRQGAACYERFEEEMMVL